MIISRSPLRISLGGGGTDIPSYYQDFGGYVISAAIDKYVYVTVMRPFNKGIYLKYSEIEQAKIVEQVKHPIIREVLKLLNLRTPQIEISSLADIPAGTGLGSSGSFTTALIKSLYTHYQKTIHPKELAELACEIELTKLKEPIGKQDQYISAFGGITEFTFEISGEVKANSLELPIETIHDLEDNLLLFYTGQSRSASKILESQVKNTINRNEEMLQNLHKTKEIGIQIRNLLKKADTHSFAMLMHEHWVQKRNRSSNISNNFIDEIYEKGIKSGAVGGKLVGAGGGGFLMFYAKDSEKLRSAMKQNNMEEVRFKFDFEGTKVTSS